MDTEQNQEPRTESQDQLQTLRQAQGDTTQERHATLIFKPQKTWVMRVNIKMPKGKPTTIKLLVQAEDYVTAKEVAEDFVNKYKADKTYISNITGNALDYEYLLKHKAETHEG